MDDFFSKVTSSKPSKKETSGKKGRKNICKGKQANGSRCKDDSYSIVGFCIQHLDQVNWTRELVEKMLEARKLDPFKHSILIGADLTGLDLSVLNFSLVQFSSSGLIDRDSPLSLEAQEIGIVRCAKLGKVNISKSNLHGANLSKVNFQGANLHHTNLESAFLVGAKLDNVYIASASFNKAKLMGAVIRAISQSSTPNTFGILLSGFMSIAISHGGDGPQFSEANLENAVLKDSFLAGANFTKAILKNADLTGAFLKNASFQGANLESADLREVNLSEIKKYGLVDARLYKSKLDRTLINRNDLGSVIWEEKEKEYLKAREIYLKLKQNFDDLGDYESASWAYIKERQMEKRCSSPLNVWRSHSAEELKDIIQKKSLVFYPKVWWFYVRHFLKWLNDWLVEMICGYVERPWRTVFSLLFVYMSFFYFYWLSGSVSKVVLQDNGTTNLVVTRDLLDIARFTLGAFTTMGANNLSPQAGWVEIVMGIEALLGISLTGLLGFVIGNRIRRS